MRSKGLSLPWIKRSGVGAGSCRFSGEGGTRLALRTAPAPSLAVVDGTLVSRPGDLDAASRAAIWEVEEREAAEGRPLTLNDVLAVGESGHCSRRTSPHIGSPHIGRGVPGVLECERGALESVIPGHAQPLVRGSGLAIHGIDSPQSSVSMRVMRVETRII